MKKTYWLIGLVAGVYGIGLGFLILVLTYSNIIECQFQSRAKIFCFLPIFISFVSLLIFGSIIIACISEKSSLFIWASISALILSSFALLSTIGILYLPLAILLLVGIIMEIKNRRINPSEPLRDPWARRGEFSPNLIIP